jgi:di/tricarboxylate transporter
MDSASIFVTILTLLVLVALVSGKVSFDAIGIGLLVALVGSGILDSHDALKGFGNHAVVTIAALYVVGEGLTRTGAVEFLAHGVLSIAKGRETVLVLAVCFASAALSAFLNNTAVVVVFIPLLVGLSGKTGIPASRLLIPMAYASLLGGTCTLVGTSTNLLVSGAAEREGEAALAMFEMSPIGIPFTIVGILFLAFFSRYFIPTRTSLSSTLSTTKPREYVTELVIGPTSPLAGKQVSEAFGDKGPRLLFLIRDEDVINAPTADTQLEVGDVLMLRGDVSQLTDMQLRLGLKMVGNVKFDPRTMTFFELAVSPHSSLVGRRIRDLHLWRDYSVVMVAVLRHGHHIRERASNLILRAGDLLLVCGDQTSSARLRASTDFYLVTGAHHLVVLRGHARRAMAIAAGVVTLFTLYSVVGLKAVPIPAAAMLGAVAMVASGCVTARRAYRTIDWPILIFVVGTLALGEAMRETGAAGLYARGLVQSLQEYGAVAVVGGVVLLAIILNAFVSHSAVAVLLTPIAIEMGHAMPEVGARPFIIAVAFGGSIAFATPLGHQVSLMVYGPGGYKYSDFVRIGVPLSLISWVFVTWAIGVQFGL